MFERIELLNEEPLKACPACGAPVKRQISAPRVGTSESGFDDKAKHAGFSKLRRTGKGEYKQDY